MVRFFYLWEVCLVCFLVWERASHYFCFCQLIYQSNSVASQKVFPKHSLSPDNNLWLFTEKSLIQIFLPQLLTAVSVFIQCTLGVSAVAFWFRLGISRLPPLTMLWFALQKHFKTLRLSYFWMKVNQKINSKSCSPTARECSAHESKLELPQSKILDLFCVSVGSSAPTVLLFRCTPSALHS